ncbi:MAG TPA: RluA family pseudouridine synthase [Polyangiales bacterium]|nr:RluA family pseudouridine synthase [Polyangiales bacterium]
MTQALPPIELTLEPTEIGERIDRVLSARGLGLSRSQLQALLLAGRVSVEGKPARAKDKVRAPARVRIEPLPPPPSAAAPEDLPLTILFEDEHLVVILKAAGMVVHPAPGHAGGTLVNALRYHRELEELEADTPERPGIVHRLDKDTSGVMVVAKSVAAREGLIAQFKQHDLEREYLAIAHGRPAAQFTLDTWHGRHPHDRKRFTTKLDRGKRAVTHVRVLEHLHGSSLVACTLETGRTHQIRVHLAEHGYPILGDTLYGKTPRDPRLAEAAARLGHQALHARLLGFVHPVTGERVSFSAEPPEEFLAALALLRD